ncbi:MAG: hypothetical protein ISS11_07040 [Candidatus Marinimicrobia bacterium]|nr:hypothetical protein [Candidatus Neomarinimicrobiota bacterium]
MIKLSTHEQKILDLIKINPKILMDPLTRKQVAIDHGMSEKTLRNRIGDLKRYGLVDEKGIKDEIQELSETNMQKNLFILWKRRWFIFKNVTIVSIASIIISLMLPKWYSSQAIILSLDAGSFSFLSSFSPFPVSEFGLSGISEDITKFIAILNSRSVKEHMVNKFDLVNRYNKTDIEFAMAAFEEMMELEISDEGTLKISVLDKNPKIAKKMVAELLIQLDSINQRLSMDKGKYNRKFLERRLYQAEKDLSEAEIQLMEFQQKTGIIDILTQIGAQYESYGQLYGQEMLAYTELFSLKAQTEVQLNVSKATLSFENPTVKRYEAMLNEQEKQLKQITSRLDKHLQEVLFGLDIDNQLGDLTEISGKIPKLIDFKTFPALGMENARLLREVTIQNTLLELLLPQYETARLEESKNIPTLQVIDEPKVAINKVKPKRSIIVIASTLMAFLFSVIFIYIDYHSLNFRKKLKNI